MQKNVKYLIGIVSALILSIGVGFFLVYFQDEGKNYDGSEVRKTENFSVQQNSSATENSAEASPSIVLDSSNRFFDDGRLGRKSL